LNPGAALGERRLAVREAAADWQRAGLIDEATRGAIDAAYADDRQRVGTALRVLLFVFAWIAAQSASGFFMIFTQGKGLGVISLLTGIACALACELLRNRLRRSQSGAEEAAGFMAVGFLTGGVGWLLFETLASDRRALLVVLAVGAGLSLVAAWRWGGAVYGALAAAGVFLDVLRLPAARWIWLVLAAILALPLLRLAESPSLAPTQRRGAWAALAVAIAAAYCAVHLGLWDTHAIEWMSDGLGGSRNVTMPRAVAIAGTALLPLGLLGAGLAGRRRLLLDVGLLSGLVSLVTAVVYLDLRPEWMVLVAGGLGLIGAALAVRKLLDLGPGKERIGLTAEPLFENPDRQSLVELAASLAALSPAARREPPAAGFAGGGGEMGGGGASGSF
jgi:hypothetical protein